MEYWPMYMEEGVRVKVLSEKRMKLGSWSIVRRMLLSSLSMILGRVYTSVSSSVIYIIGRADEK